MTTSLAVLVVMIQLCDSYLHYLSFRDAMTSTEQKNLSIRFLIWSVVCTAIYDCLFREFSMTASLFKGMLMIGWIPWLAIMILTVRREISQHIFVFGMMKIWSLMQHNWSAIICVLIGLEAPEFFFAHSVVYLLLFAICLPLCETSAAQKIFRRLRKTRCLPAVHDDFQRCDSLGARAADSFVGRKIFAILFAVRILLFLSTRADNDGATL